VGVAIDKHNRVFTTEQEPGRLQVFRYVTDAEAAAEKVKRDEELQKAAERRQKAAAPAPESKPAGAPAQKPAEDKQN
jgi:hypothetical protein